MKLRIPTVLTTIFLALMPFTASAQDLNALFGSLQQTLDVDQDIGVGGCEDPTEVAFFQNTGCPGFLDAFYEEDVETLQRSRAQVVLYATGLIEPLYQDTTFFVQGTHFMHRLPPRVPYALRMLRLRTPEVLGLQIGEGLRSTARVLDPLAQKGSGITANDLRSAMRQLGVQPIASVILTELGRHDSYLLQIWAEEDPDGLVAFLNGVQATINRL